MKPTHNDHCCGDYVVANPEHIEDSLARFLYSFQDGSVFHLNILPLRQQYVRRLMRAVGFQQIETYGNFQESYRGTEPDFFIHVAEKACIELEPTQ